MADQELPHNPESVGAILLLLSCADAPADRVKVEAFELWAREGCVLGTGEAVREAKGECRSWSLAEVASSSSSIDIRRRVRGRNVDAAGAVPVFEEEGDPLSAGMAMESRAVLAKVEQHRTSGGGRDGGRAWH